MAESTDMEVGWRADVGNVLIKIEMFVEIMTLLYRIPYAYLNLAFTEVCAVVYIDYSAW